MTDDERRTAEETITETIDGAEEVQDPLEGLVEKTRIDPGAPFTAEVLERLAALKKDDRAVFETLRSQLKSAGCRVMALDEALDEENGGAGGRRPTQADILIDLAQAAELFHTSDSTCFADLDVDGHRETWPIRSKGFRRWLARRFFEETDGAPNSEALMSAFNVIEAKAHFDAPERIVHIRVGGLDGRIYLDLCDEAWRAVEIDSAGWRVIDKAPVRFRRAAGMLPLPAPVAGSSIEELRPFLNVRSDTEFILSVAWLLAALRELGPYPVLALFGEHGTAKTTFAMLLRALIDPNVLPVRTPPRDDRDLLIAATNSHVQAIDNLSFLLDWISDALCRLSTGGGLGTRQLYTDQDEVLLEAERPTILNGIEEVVNRPDLADRALFLTLAPIPEDKRRPESELWPAFEAVRPRILGALLDAVAEGLSRLPEIRLQKLPRMADFAIWASACETGLQYWDGTFWKAGTFMDAYAGNIDEAVETILNANPVATAVRTLMATQTTWTGSATDLLALLERIVGDKASKAKTWPADATRLSGRLRRAATFLRKAGIEISIDRSRKDGRTITITTFSEPAVEGDKATSHGANGSGTADKSNDTGNGANDANDAEPPPSNGSEKEGMPFLSEGRVRELAGDYQDAAASALEETGDVDHAALERRLRETLVADGVPPTLVAAELARILEIIAAL
jgi:hypothetical protein